MMECNTVNALGKELKRLRKEKNLLQEDVAKQLQIKRQTYSHYETGRVQPSVRNLCLLASLYEVPIQELLKYVDMGGGKDENVLSMQEIEMLNCYRKLDERDREDILVFMKAKGNSL